MLSVNSLTSPFTIWTALPSPPLPSRTASRPGELQEGCPQLVLPPGHPAPGSPTPGRPESQSGGPSSPTPQTRSGALGRPTPDPERQKTLGVKTQFSPGSNAESPTHRVWGECLPGPAPHFPLLSHRAAARTKARSAPRRMASQGCLLLPAPPQPTAAW